MWINAGEFWCGRRTAWLMSRLALRARKVCMISSCLFPGESIGRHVGRLIASLKALM